MPRALITGASPGVGAAVAHVYAGAHCALGRAARRVGALAELALALPGEVRAYALVVTNHGAAQRSAEDFMANLEALDVVIAKTGVAIVALSAEPRDVARGLSGCPRSTSRA